MSPKHLLFAFAVICESDEEGRVSYRSIPVGDPSDEASPRFPSTEQELRTAALAVADDAQAKIIGAQMVRQMLKMAAEQQEQSPRIVTPDIRVGRAPRR